MAGRRQTHPRASNRSSLAAQRGAVLVVGLVMLLLVTLGAVASVRMAATHVQVAANEQFRVEAMIAANYALDLAISSPDMTQAELLPPLEGVSLQQVGQVSGAHALPVKYVAPQCHRYRYLKNSELMAKNSLNEDVPRTPEDVHCVRTSAPGGVAVFGPDGSASVDDNSLCMTALWELGAEVSDPQTGASITLTQGVEMQMEISDAEQMCRS